MAGAAIAEQPNLPTLETEEYAHSRQNLARWGAARLLRDEVWLQQQAQSFEDLSRDDYRSGLTEMLRTDSEFKDVLDINNKRGHRIIDGQACAADGTPMVSMITDGSKKSEALADKNPVFRGQAIRDAGDVIVAERADQLKPGQTLFALSMVPVNDLKVNRKEYLQLGYRDDLSYLQYYSRTADGTIIAGDYSIDLNDETTWRQLFADLGHEVPADADPNTFIRHGFVEDATPEEAEKLVRDMRSDYYERRGATERRYSVSEYVDQHDDLVNEFFDAYYPSLAEASYSGQNNPIMRGFAQTLLTTNIEKLKPEIGQELRVVANSDSFSSKSFKAMESLVRYAVVEELRKGLKGFVGQETAGSRETMTWSVPLERQNPTIPGVKVVYNMDRLLADNVAAGIKANRSYGGCPGQVELGDNPEAKFNPSVKTLSPQAAYGGREGLTTDEDCEFVSKKCPECGQKDVKTRVRKAAETNVSETSLAKISKKHITGECGCSKTVYQEA